VSIRAAECLARALLFEGYLLYPYRASSLKNRQRWAFGCLYPPAFCDASRAGDASSMTTECLVSGAAPTVRIAIRFLQRTVRPTSGDESPNAWQEVVERAIELEPIALEALDGATEERFHDFPAARVAEDETERCTELLDVRVVIGVERLGPSVRKLSVTVANETRVEPNVDRTAAELQALSSTHTLLEAEDGAFVSLLEPPNELTTLAQGCKNVGTFPVLVGDRKKPVVLSSPVILYDFPRIAPESAGDLFDSTEIDEILTLRIRTLTDEERREAFATDPRARALIERTDRLGEEDLGRLHGAWRSAAAFGPGDHVVIKPRPGGDVLDLALAGEKATVATVEEDFEGRVYFTVTVDRDPGRDLGLTGQPGHRFFFTADELERAP